jgi:flagellar basal-body rod protein FlgF
MAGGTYVALSGLQQRAAHLDRLAADIANAGTSGYKAERSTTTAAERARFDRALEAAIDVAAGPARSDFRAGSLAPTGRDLDVAIDGRGFFVIDTPAGPRYTRNGHFDRSADGTLVSDGGIVAGENGPIRLGRGALEIAEDGTVSTGGTVVGRLRVVDFADYTRLVREGSSRFRADGETPLAPQQAIVRGGTLEKSNVSVVDRIAELTQVSRTFDALQRGITLLNNELDGRVISDLGRRW